jgi:hypothetical protein
LDEDVAHQDRNGHSQLSSHGFVCQLEGGVTPDTPYFTLCSGLSAHNQSLNHIFLTRLN